VSKTQDCLLLVVLSGPRLLSREQLIVNFAHNLSGKLGATVEILIFRSPSLAHYGEVDTLASFKDKHEFISYVKGLDRDEEMALGQKLQNLCPGAKVHFIQKDSLEQFLKKRQKKILFALTLIHKTRKFITFKRSSFLKILKKKGINILEIRDMAPLKDLGMP